MFAARIWSRIDLGLIATGKWNRVEQKFVHYHVWTDRIARYTKAQNKSPRTWTKMISGSMSCSFEAHLKRNWQKLMCFGLRHWRYNLGVSRTHVFTYWKEKISFCKKMYIFCTRSHFDGYKTSTCGTVNSEMCK